MIGISSVDYPSAILSVLFKATVRYVRISHIFPTSFDTLSVKSESLSDMIHLD